ncbi:M23 family metallopeptidase [Alloalcanivorax xenomutans]|uniref:M23 family metallopeptidase n=1 Tax=Alloalcanivorax xenomutans TaxID=1094342 RepID=UPI000BD43AFB|nr:M23 family metallopeptidase [Alloalcanivorax xenomutans]SOC21658.1 peptidase M23-like protein [Alloalcanivorax xenomutans]
MVKGFRLKRGLWALLVVVAAGLLLPEHARIPVQGATASDWHPKSFWFEPWGASGVHKGIDIFAVRGTPVVSAVPGIRLYQGELSLGGKVVIVLGPKWRLHYYAHLNEPATPMPLWVAKGRQIGGVGDSGNARGKPPHLHYSVLSLIPLPWRMTTETQGWKKMFFLDPVDVFTPRGH